MLRIICALSFVTLLTVALSAEAQQRGDKKPAVQAPAANKDDLKTLQAELEKLKTQIQELEARIQKFKGEKPNAEPEPKKDGRRGGRAGQFDPEQLKKLTERLRGAGKGKLDPEQFKKLREQFVPPGQKKPDEPKKPAQPKQPDGATSVEIEPRLETVIQANRNRND